MNLKEIFSFGIDKALDSAKGLVTTFVKDKGLQQEINAELEKNLQALKLKEHEYKGQLLNAEVSDRANARKMNISTSKNNDVVIRRFPVFLASAVLLLSGILLVAMLFVPIPEANRDILNIAFGTLMGGGLSTVLNFYFGSSYVNDDNEKEEKRLPTSKN
jgi:hypothetical protein